MSKKSFIKDPGDVLDYQINWADWLADDTISGTKSTWTVETGITEDSNTNTTTGTIIWVSGGTAGENYNLVNHIETVSGRKADRTIVIKVRER